MAQQRAVNEDRQSIVQIANRMNRLNERFGSDDQYK